MWSREISSRWRSKPNLGRNRQCVLCAWPTDGLRHAQARHVRSLTKSEMHSRKVHTCTHTHRHRHRVTKASHITWGSYERNGEKVMHSFSYMQTHAPAHGHTHTRIHGHSHRSQSSPTARTLAVFPFTVAYTLAQIAHKYLSLRASLHSTLNQETSFFIAFTAYHYELLSAAWSEATNRWWNNV